MGKKFNLAEYVDPNAPAPPSMEIHEVPIQLIDQNWKNFYAVDWQETDLAETIKVSGLLTPLGVIRDGDRFKLISGHRRLKAIRHIRDSEPDGRERWATVPCVIYATPEDADRQELMLIHANAQRIKTGPEIAKEAEKTTEILIRMKERGAELPGRMRERVAEALQVSSTRLARLEAIKNNLTYPGWVRKWEGQAINESVAYRLSQLDYSQQMHTADWMIDHNVADKDVSVKLIEEALAHPPLNAPGCADPLAYEEDPVKVDRELVRRAGFLNYFSGARFANRKDGMDQLKVTFRNSGHGDSELDWDGEPKGIRFKKPIDWLLSWGAMYDALAANALDEAVSNLDHAPGMAEPEPDPRAVEGDGPYDGKDPMTAQKVTTSQLWWRSCRDDPPKGWTLAVVFTPVNKTVKYFDVDLMQYHDGLWWGVYDACDDEMDASDSWWMPAAAVPAEVWS